ncbi:MAG: fatty acid cis/trans isomerase [Candidatus Pelagadaptatus aseana]
MLEKRCVVCHACYDAPCQLKYTSLEGIHRGTSKQKVYSGARPLAIDPQRLFIDAHSEAQWRKRGFSSVLGEPDPVSGAVQLDSSLMHQVLQLKQQNPLPRADILSDAFDLSLNRDSECPKPAEFKDYAARNPLAGMPYALPGLNASEQTVLLDWIEQGAPDDTPSYVVDEEQAAQIQQWESLLNGDSLQAQLAARYVYEHWFLGSLHFPEAGSDTFFKLVRSSTPPGQPIQMIATRRPYDDPGVERVYYRLWRDPQTVVAKTHMPLALGKSQYQAVRQLLFDLPYPVTALPGYDVATGSNPFKTFAQIPLDSKYRFLIMNGQFTIMGFIKGPVCRGQTALNVVNDHFWVFFVDPDANVRGEFESLLAQQTDNLRLPAESGSNALTLTNWLKYINSQKTYVAAKQSWVKAVLEDGGAIGPEIVWDGDGSNPNAALTVFRHFDSATVEKGLIGNVPKTAWLIDYAMLERIHYLLVAGYDVFGNVGHQFNTRVYMDYLRYEAEFALLSLFPAETQRELFRHWYRDTPRGFDRLIGQAHYYLDLPVSINYQTDQPFSELMTLLKGRVDDALSHRFSFRNKVRHPIEALNELPNTAIQLLPQVSVILVADDQDFTRVQSSPEAYSLLRNNAHSNIAVMFFEDDRHLSEEDSATLVPGFIGDYPGALWYVPRADIVRFTEALSQVRNERDYRKLRDQYGVRRTHPDFWRFSDLLHTAADHYRGLDYGVFDLNRLENR